MSAPIPTVTYLKTRNVVGVIQGQQKSRTTW